MKRILVIEDRSPMLEALRAVLEEADQAYQVHGVPSAEEALLELRRISFDLLITDVRLPGMSGFELVGKVKDREPNLPIIMITAYASQQGRKVAEELGVAHYLAKPVDADLLTDAIQSTIQEAEALSPAPVAPELPEEAKTSSAAVPVRLRPDLDVAVQQRLERLHAEAGSGQILLIDRVGEVVVQVGESRGLNQRALAQTIAAIMDNSARLRGQLGGGQPAAVHYLTGSELDVFCASVEAGYCLALLLGSTSGRGRLGTVWTYTRRAVGDLRELMKSETVFADPAAEAEGEAPLAAAAEVEVLEQSGHEVVGADPPPSVPAGARTEEVEQDASLSTESKPLPAELAGKTGPQMEGERDHEIEEPLSLETLQEMLDLEPGDLAITDLDAFWDTAVLDQPGLSTGQEALSYEEAQRLGLLPPDFEPEPDEDD